MDAPNPPRRPPLAVVFAITVTGIAVNTLITPGLPDILDGLGAPRSLAGLIISAATLPGIVFAPVIGVLADRYGRREALVPCLVLFGVAGGLIALAPSLPVLLVLRFVQGGASAGLVNLAIVIIGDSWDGPERARMIGRNAAVLTVAIAVFPVLGGWLTDLGGWRAPFLAYPAALATAVAAARGLPRGERRDTRLSDQLREALPFVRTRAVSGVLAASVAVFALIFGLLLTVLPLHLEQAFDLGAGARGLLMGIPAAASTVTAVSVGWWTRRVGRPRVLVAANALLMFALLAVAGAPALVWLPVGLLLFGLGEGALVPTLQDIGLGAAPNPSRGAVVAMIVSASRIGQTVGPIAAGALFAATGAATTFVAGAVVAALMLVVALGSASGGRRSE